MKKAFSTKLLALFVLVLTVATLAVVSSAATWGDPATTGYITTGEIVGATIDVKSTADNGDGTYTIVFDVNVADGYMIEDSDLHDGYIPVEPVVIVKEHQVDGSFNRVVIEKLEKGDNAGYYVVKNWTVDCDIEVECVTPVVITYTGVIDEDLTFEQDGHVYVLSNVANYADITILNSRTDYTKGIVDVFKGVAGVAVDDYGHITDLNNATTSYFASVYFTGTFANMDEATINFTYANVADSVTTSANVNKASAIPYELNPKAWFAGRFIIFGQSTSDFVNRGTINVNACGVYVKAKNIINYGTINASNNVDKTNRTTNLFLLANVENAGTINAHNVNLYVGGAYDYSYDVATHTYVAALNESTLTNKATMDLDGTTLTVYSLDNKADAVIDLSILEYINPLTGKEASRASSLVLTTASKNAGIITVVGKDNYGIKFNTLNNSGEISVTGDGVDGEGQGLLTNSGTFLFSTKEAEFEYKYTSNTFTRASDLGKWELYENIIYWNTPNGRDDGGKRVAHKNCHSGAECVAGCFDATKTADVITPAGIENSGTMTFKGISTGAGEAQFKNRGVYIVNNGELTIDMKFRNNFTKFAQVEVNGNGADWRTTAGWATTCNGDIENYGTLNLGGSVGNVSYVPYLYNAENAIVNINGKYEVMDYDEVGAGQRMEFESGLVVLYDVDAQLLNYGTVNVAAKGVVSNWGDIINAGTVNVAGLVNNYDWIYVQRTGVVNISGAVNNGDADHVCNGSLVKCNHIGLLEIAGSVVNTGKLNNDWNSDIRIEKGATLDNVNGLVTNCGIIVNVGTFTTTVEGLDNQFAINGYDVTYVNKAETEAPADSEEDTKAPADDNAADTQAPTKTPAAQTSDIAVAGLAIIATLSLAGVVVAKKVR